APFGPRCMALVPGSQSAKLGGLTLPDSPEREALYAVQKPLLAHDRAAAVAALAQMTEQFPGHPRERGPLARSAEAGAAPALPAPAFAELALARYDAHPVKLLDAYDRLLARFPHEATWVLSKAAVLRELNRMPERVALLEAEADPLNAEPLVMQSLAQALL